MTKSKTKSRLSIPIRPWKELLEEYLLRQDIKRHSKLTKIKYNQILIDLFDSLKMKDPSSKKIRNFLNNLVLDGEHKDITVDKYLTIIKTFFKWCHDHEYITHDPSANIPFRGKGKDGVKLVKHFTEAQMDQLYLAVEQDNRVLVQDVVMFDVFYGTMMRCNELCSLEIPDIDFKDGIIKIRNGKGGKQRFVAIPKKTLKELKKFVQSLKIKFPTTNFVFPNSRGQRMDNSYVYRRMSRIMGKMADEKKGAHRLRHSGATVMLDRGAPLVGIQKQLGHSSLSSTEIYLHTAVKRLKNVHGQAHPKG
jgi:site-specific recombinase XerD